MLSFQITEVNNVGAKYIMTEQVLLLFIKPSGTIMIYNYYIITKLKPGMATCI